MSCEAREVLFAARIDQLRNIARYYRRNHETASAELMDWTVLTLLDQDARIREYHLIAAVEFKEVLAALEGTPR